MLVELNEENFDNGNKKWSKACRVLYNLVFIL